MAPTPIGLQLTRTARVLSQEFDRAMADEGGSAPVWQVLLLIRSKQWGQQYGDGAGDGRDRRHAHPSPQRALEASGLVRPLARGLPTGRVQRVELTDRRDGVVRPPARRSRMRHDKRLRSRLTAEEAEQLGALLEKLRAGVEDEAATPAA